MASGSASSFVEVADRVWVARHEWFDLNLTLVGGTDGLVLVDTHASADAAREVVVGIRALGVGPVTAVVNTHEHFDHTFGNGALRASYDAPGAPRLPIVAHETAAAATVAAGERIKRLYREDRDDPHRDEVIATEIVPASRTFSSATVLDLGDRALELVHPGRGHTGGDLVVRVPDADVLVAGDQVEEAPEREHTPGFGTDCFPMEWPISLDLVIGLLSSSTVVVPGHGALVDREFVTAQRDRIGVLAETIRHLAGSGVPLDEAIEAGEWPFPRELLADGIRRGYEHLPRSQKRLPLV